MTPGQLDVALINRTESGSPDDPRTDQTAVHDAGTQMPNMTIISASFFWRNDQPDGLGVTFGHDDFSPSELATLFQGETVRQYFRDSDAALGSSIVDDYLSQLGAIAQQARHADLPMHLALMAALNIMWLAERGFIPNDEFNGPIFVDAE